MKTLEKPTPIVSLPENWSAFNGRGLQPWPVTRAEVAATLWRARKLRLLGQARILYEAAGLYRLSTFNTLILNTRPGR